MEDFLLEIEYALLSTQRALLGEVIPGLRAVIIDLNQDEMSMHVCFYCDGEISEKQLDTWECVTTEASASMLPGFMLEPKIEQLDYPQKIPLKGYFAYLRKEENGLLHKNNSFSKVEIKEPSLGYAMLATQYALLGIVSPELRVVIVDFNNENSLLYIRFYYDKEIPKPLMDLWQNAITKIREDFAPNCLLDGKIERIDYPKTFPFRGRYAYFRKELSLESSY